MNIITYVKALVGIGDIDAFWCAREKIIKKKRSFFENFLCKIIRKRYGAGIPVLEEIIRFNTPLGFYGIFISKDAVIGIICTILHQVTIGSDLFGGGAPIVGNNCLIGAGAKIIGNVKIGDDVKVGANAIVVEDIPDGCTVVMNKPRILIKKR